MQFYANKAAHFSELCPRVYGAPISSATPPPPKLRLSSMSFQLKKLQIQSHLEKLIFVVSPTTSKPRLGRHLLCSNSSNVLSTTDQKSWIEAVGEVISTAFPVWVALGCLVGLVRPSSFNWVQPKWTVMGITLTMLGMGMTLTFDDLRGALAMPKELFTGFMLQYSVLLTSPYFLRFLLIWLCLINVHFDYQMGLNVLDCLCFCSFTFLGKILGP